MIRLSLGADYWGCPQLSYLGTSKLPHKPKIDGVTMRLRDVSEIIGMQICIFIVLAIFLMPLLAFILFLPQLSYSGALLIICSWLVGFNGAVFFKRPYLMFKSVSIPDDIKNDKFLNINVLILCRTIQWMSFLNPLMLYYIHVYLKKTVVLNVRFKSYTQIVELENYISGDVHFSNYDSTSSATLYFKNESVATEFKLSYFSDIIISSD